MSGRVLTRLSGLETEYAIRWSRPFHARHHIHPGHKRIYEVIAEVIAERVTLHQSAQWFTENGGAFSYECSDILDGVGLFEAATPECRGPSQLLLYQKAQDQLLIDVLPAAEERLKGMGFEGSLGLLKNCRDAEGNVYGAQENYEAILAQGWELWLFRAGLLAMLPVFVPFCFLWWSMLMVFLIVFLAAMLIVPLVRLLGFNSLSDGDDLLEHPWVGVMIPLLMLVVSAPVIVPMSMLVRTLSFRRQRRAMLGFLIARPVISGAGTVEEGELWLNEKGAATESVAYSIFSTKGRGIFDATNLNKMVMSPFLLRPRHYFRLFQARQRFQIGMSDSNMAQFAEFLKIGTTTLVLDMAEAGLLEDAPQPAQPIAALQAIIRDPTLQVRVPLKGGGEMSALELQHFYLACARRWLANSPLISLEACEVVRLWAMTLDALETDPDQLIGRLDWVTKRFLLESCADTPDPAVLKKIDLRYHELGTGYLARLERAGTAEQMTDPNQVRDAIHQSPPNTPALLRSRLMKKHHGLDLPIAVSWDTVRIGGLLRGKIIHLNER